MGNKLGDRIKNVMSAVFEIPVEQIQDKSSPDTIESWDSLKHMELIASIEDVFEVELSFDEIVAMRTFKEIKQVLSTKGIEG